MEVKQRSAKATEIKGGDDSWSFGGRREMQSSRVHTLYLWHMVIQRQSILNNKFESFYLGK